MIRIFAFHFQRLIRIFSKLRKMQLVADHCYSKGLVCHLGEWLPTVNFFFFEETGKCLKLAKLFGRNRKDWPARTVMLKNLHLEKYHPFYGFYLQICSVLLFIFQHLFGELITRSKTVFWAGLYSFYFKFKILFVIIPWAWIIQNNKIWIKSALKFLFE